MIDVKEHISVVNPGHAVVDGLGDGFDLVDEAYLAQVFEDDVEPLLRSDFAYEDENFFSTANAVAGRRSSRDGWSHPRGSNLVAWVRPHPTSRIVYIQPGDGPETYANPAYRRLLGNAIAWAADHDGPAARRGSVGEELAGGPARD